MCQFATQRVSVCYSSKTESGKKVALTVGDYFDRSQVRVDEWRFNAAPPEFANQFPRFKTPYFERILSDWLNLILQTGFQLEKFAEPTANDDALRQHPPWYDTRIVAYFLIVRCRKPS